RCEGKELLGFLDSDGLLLGIGILESLLRRRKILRAYTNVSPREVAEIECGRIRLSCRGEELD
ncbi:MAG: polyhydroxyalkanoate depolymerase, partial [Candidatus Bathyarchaeia archaeon]